MGRDRLQWRSTEGTNKGEISNPGGGHSAISKVPRWWRNCNGWGGGLRGV